VNKIDEDSNGAECLQCCLILIVRSVNFIKVAR